MGALWCSTTQKAASHQFIDGLLFPISLRHPTAQLQRDSTGSTCYTASSPPNLFCHVSDELPIHTLCLGCAWADGAATNCDASDSQTALTTHRLNLKTSSFKHLCKDQDTTPCYMQAFLLIYHPSPSQLPLGLDTFIFPLPENRPRYRCPVPTAFRFVCPTLPFQVSEVLIRYTIYSFLRKAHFRPLQGTSTPPIYAWFLRCIRGLRCGFDTTMA